MSLYRSISFYVFFFFKQKTAYEMRISDWSSDVCSSDLHDPLILEATIHVVDRNPRAGADRLGGMVSDAPRQRGRNAGGDAFACAGHHRIGQTAGHAELSDRYRHGNGAADCNRAHAYRWATGENRFKGRRSEGQASEL